jgi:hypothetical protein
MNTPIAFNTNICFTGAPASGLEQTAIAIRNVAEAATSCGIPFFDQKVWVDPESALLREGLEKAQKLFLVADTFLGVHGPRGEEQGFYLLRGPLDVMALARMQSVALPPEFGKTCSRLLERVQLVAFQLPDPDGWRWQGFDQRRIAWFTNYTKTLFETAREHGLKLEQLRVLPPQRGDANGSVSEVSWRIFGVGLNLLKPADRTKPLASAMRTYEVQCREIFDGRNGSVFGVPHLV